MVFSNVVNHDTPGPEDEHKPHFDEQCKQTAEPGSVIT